MKYENLKRSLQELNINMENPNISRRVGEKDLYKKLQETIIWFKNNFDKTIDLLESNNVLNEFESNINILLGSTRQDTFQVHTFINKSLYLIKLKESMDTSEDVLDTASNLTSKLEESELTKIVEFVANKLGLDNDLRTIIKAEITEYRNLNDNLVKKNEKYLGTIVGEANKAKEEQLVSLKKIEEKYKNIISETEGTIIGINAGFKKVQEEIIKDLKRNEDELEELKKQTTKSIKDFEKSHKESINLKESKKYWNRKSWKHTFWAGVYFVIFIIIIAIPILGLLFISRDTLSSMQSASLPQYGIYILGVSLWLWIARIALKISLSNRHLSEEANEKKTMISTYLALTKEGQMGEDNKKIILEAIFRPTANGIIKDDSAVTLLDLVKAIKK